jgi:hypothetical protein
VNVDKETVDIEREQRWLVGCAIGEAVWLRRCERAGKDPKDKKLANERMELVDDIREAAVAFNKGGIKGVDAWLKFEKRLDS